MRSGDQNKVLRIAKQIEKAVDEHNIFLLCIIAETLKTSVDNMRHDEERDSKTFNTPDPADEKAKLS